MKLNVLARGALLVQGVLGLLATGAWALEVPITDFVQVSPGIYRGARPDADGLKALAELGIRTDIDLENDDEAIAAERPLAESLNIKFVSEPMSGFFEPSDRRVNRVLKVLSDSASYPVFVHCKYGHDRTGLIVGLYRVSHEKWNPARAYDEMIDRGFHSLLLGLQHLWEERTGYDP